MRQWDKMSRPERESILSELYPHRSSDLIEYEAILPWAELLPSTQADVQRIIELANQVIVSGFRPTRE